MALIGNSEKEDFFGSVKRHSYGEKDFEILEKADPMRGIGVEPITGIVIIRCKSSGIEKSYKAGHGSTWPAEFDQDLARGVFGKRSA